MEIAQPIRVHVTNVVQNQHLFYKIHASERTQPIRSKNSLEGKKGRSGGGGGGGDDEKHHTMRDLDLDF